MSDAPQQQPNAAPQAAHQPGPAPGVDPNAAPQAAQQTTTDPQQPAAAEPNDPAVDGITLAELRALLPEEGVELAQAAVQAQQQPPAPAPAPAPDPATAAAIVAAQQPPAPSQPAQVTQPVQPQPQPQPALLEPAPAPAPDPATAAAVVAAQEKEKAAQPQPHVMQPNMWTENAGTIAQPDMGKIMVEKNALEQRRNELNNKFTAGDIEQTQYMSDLQTIVSEMARLDAIPASYDMAVNAQRHELEQRWNTTVQQYEKAYPELLAPEHVRGWDSALRSVTSAYPTLNHVQAIQLAHHNYAQMTQLLGNPLSTPPPVMNGAQVPTTENGQTTQPAIPGKAQIEQNLAPKPAAPTTLRNVPGENAIASAPQIGDALDAVLDSRRPDDAETLLTRMSPEHADAWLRGEI